MRGISRCIIATCGESAPTDTGDSCGERRDHATGERAMPGTTAKVTIDHRIEGSRVVDGEVFGHYAVTPYAGRPETRLYNITHTPSGLGVSSLWGGGALEHDEALRVAAYLDEHFALPGDVPFGPDAMDVVEEWKEENRATIDAVAQAIRDLVPDAGL